ncbi:Homeodomain-like domain containing protein [uncultured Caudovirales phage]|uniref:Homeodomain-like domain containing protein n=1 Tax=uncultured Caudovirales phage TaxID=2100421 RepID=A0A6J7WN98_9CAUD|nr:Homeodomain-like domain containing protein [uncultured Caudovirales phage]
MTIFQLATNERFFKYCKAITKGNDIYKDLINDVILIMYDKDIPEYAIENMARVIAWREYNSKYSEFNKKLGTKESFELLDNIQSIEARDIEEEHFIAINVIDRDLIKSIAEDNFPLQYEVFKMYQKLKSIRAVSIYFGISKSTIHRWIKDYRERIIQKIEYESTK